MQTATRQGSGRQADQHGKHIFEEFKKMNVVRFFFPWVYICWDPITQYLHKKSLKMSGRHRSWWFSPVESVIFNKNQIHIWDSSWQPDKRIAHQNLFYLLSRHVTTSTFTSFFFSVHDMVKVKETHMWIVLLVQPAFISFLYYLFMISLFIFSLSNSECPSHFIVRSVSGTSFHNLSLRCS